jgi:metallophosphoesterase superfamily enzyme
MHRMTLADQTFELLPQRGMFWFEQRILIVSDPKFDHTTSFPRRDVPYSAGARASALMRLTTLLNFFEPDILLILGDLVDEQALQSKEVREGLLFWRHQFQEVQFARVHDGNPSPPSLLEDLCMIEYDGQVQISPFEFRESNGYSSGFVIAGRPHPTVKFLDRSEGVGVKAPCFHLRGASLTLPGFNSDSPSQNISPQQGDRLYVVGPTEIVELPTALALPPDPE